MQFDGSDIVDTPVRMSVGASPGDSVRVRVADGKAWITGNDSAPPNDSAEAMKEIEATNAHIDRIETENIVGDNGWINLKNGTFSYGGEALSWNGKILKVKGNIKTDSGEIGGWSISSDGFTKPSTGSYIQTTGLGYKNGSSGITGQGCAVSYDSIGVWGGSDDFSHASTYAFMTSEGDIRATGEIYGSILYENNVSLSNKYAPKSNSDPVLKKNIAKSSTKALDIINRITMHAFDWKSNGKHWDVGFIAPELHEIDPNMADPPTGEHGSYWNVNSFYMVGVLTKAVQELTERVEALEKEITHE